MRQRSLILALLFVGLVAFSIRTLPSENAGAAGTVQAPFDASYTFFDLGSVPGLPTSYGGLVILPSDPNTLLIGGSANSADGRIYSIGLTRDVDNHITGFTGTVALYSWGANNDGGVLFGPGGVLFVAQYSNNGIGQIKPGSPPNQTAYDKDVDLTAIGVASGDSVGSFNFIPAGFPGAGQLKIWTYSNGGWYTADYAADGSGTYDITNATLELTQDVGPEGFIFVPPGSPVFPANSILVSEYGNDQVATYTLDSEGNIEVASRQLVIDGLTGAEGAAIDPLTGDFLFSTFGGANTVSRLQGFSIPSTATATATPTNTAGPSSTPTNTSTAGPSSTPTRTPTVTQTPTPTSTSPAVIVNDNRGFTGGGGAAAAAVAAAGQQAEANRERAAAPQVPTPAQTIRPPNTGDGGLR